jgi:hypothetical protein
LLRKSSNLSRAAGSVQCTTKHAVARSCRDLAAILLFLYNTMFITLNAAEIFSLGAKGMRRGGGGGWASFLH